MCIIAQYRIFFESRMDFDHIVVVFFTNQSNEIVDCFIGKWNVRLFDLVQYFVHIRAQIINWLWFRINGREKKASGFNEVAVKIYFKKIGYFTYNVNSRSIDIILLYNEAIIERYRQIQLSFRYNKELKSTEAFNCNILILNSIIQQQYPS